MASTFSRLSEPSITFLMCSGLLSPRLPFASGLPAELRSDDNLPAERSEGFAYQFFVRKWAVDFSGIVKCHAALDRRAQQGDHFLSVGDRAVRPAHPHAAEAEG